MLVEEYQCAANVTEFGSPPVNIALTVVQGVTSFLSIVGSVLLILSYVLFRQLRTKSRLLITHLAVANLLDVLPNFIAVFMNYRATFNALSPRLGQKTIICGSTSHFSNSSVKTYCNLCVYLEFISNIGSLSTMFWTVCVCIHFFILVSYRNIKLASRLTYAYYVITWLIPLGISLWLLFYNWFGFEPTYSTVNCGIRIDCAPHHHLFGKDKWNGLIGYLFGFKIWQVLVFLIIPCLFVAIQCKKKHNAEYIRITSSVVIIRNVERKILLIPIIFMLLSIAAFVTDIYFIVSKDKSFRYLQKTEPGITFVHFLTRICDNSQGLINFCLFCVFTKEVRSATIDAIRRLCHCQADSRARVMPVTSWLTPVTNSSHDQSGLSYGAVNTHCEEDDDDDDNPIKPLPFN